MKQGCFFMFLLFSLGCIFRVQGVAWTEQINCDESVWEDSTKNFTLQTEVNSLTYPVIEDELNGKRLLTSSGMMCGAAVASFGLLYVMPESFTNWDRDSMSFSSLASDWKENVKEGPVWDKDDFFLNYIAHPYFGGVYYITARTAGCSRFSSFLYSALFSTFFWEYGIEAFAEVPSKQDLFVTPVIGSLVGEGMYELKKKIKRNGRCVAGKRWLGNTILCLLDPLNEIQDGFLRRKERRENRATVASWVGPMSSSGRLGLNVYVRF